MIEDEGGGARSGKGRAGEKEKKGRDRRWSDGIPDERLKVRVVMTYVGRDVYEHHGQYVLRYCKAC